MNALGFVEAIIEYIGQLQKCYPQTASSTSLSPSTLTATSSSTYDFHLGHPVSPPTAISSTAVSYLERPGQECNPSQGMSNTGEKGQDSRELERDLRANHMIPTSTSSSSTTMPYLTSMPSLAGVQDQINQSYAEEMDGSPSNHQSSNRQSANANTNEDEDEDGNDNDNDNDNNNEEDMNTNDNDRNDSDDNDNDGSNDDNNNTNTNINEVIQLERNRNSVMGNGLSPTMSMPRGTTGNAQHLVFMCYICNKKFRSKRNLFYHNKTHESTFINSLLTIY